MTETCMGQHHVPEKQLYKKKTAGTQKIKKATKLILSIQTQKKVGRISNIASSPTKTKKKKHCKFETLKSQFSNSQFEVEHPIFHRRFSIACHHHCHWLVAGDRRFASYVLVDLPFQFVFSKLKKTAVRQYRLIRRAWCHKVKSKR